MPQGCLQFVIVVFPDHTHLLFLNININEREVIASVNACCKDEGTSCEHK